MVFVSQGNNRTTQMIGYRVQIAARATQSTIRALIEHTDTVAEVHNTLRLGLPVRLVGVDAVTVS